MYFCQWLWYSSGIKYEVEVTINFPIAYPSMCYSITAVPYQKDTNWGGFDVWGELRSHNTSNFVFFNQGYISTGNEVNAPMFISIGN